MKSWIQVKSIIFILLLSVPVSVLAADIQVGAVVWYAWWNPQTEDSMRGENNPYTRSGSFSQPYNDTFESNQALIAGPYIGLSFLDRWNIGIVALVSTEYEFTGTFNVHQTGIPSNVVHVDFNASGNRYDIDSTLSYTLYKNIKLFLGYKYMMYDVTGTYIANGIPAVVAPVALDLEWEMVMQGPGIGISANIPLNTLYVFTGFRFAHPDGFRTRSTTHPNFNWCVVFRRIQGKQVQGIRIDRRYRILL